MRLVVVDGKKVGAQVELGEAPVAVGRLASCELPIDEPQASRRHFEVQKRGTSVFVKDLGSKNGTFLNETRIDGEAPLKDGDRLRVGTTIVSFESAPPPVPAGTKLGPYEVGAVHERREGLTIHEGRHASLARNVHIEVLDPDDKGAPAFLARARAASAFDHPVLLAVFDAGEHEGRTFRVCESWPDARDLDARLREGKLAPGFALGVANQVATGLAHIHGKGGVHGWLTPRVIRVNDTVAVKLEVVGGDKLIRLDPLRGDARLQALSISPEEARGLDPTAKSDVYALGCVLFRALAGVAPFDGELAQVIRSHAGEQAAPRLAAREPSLAGEVDELVARMLSKKPEGRPAAEDLAKELGELAQHAGSAEAPKPKKPTAGTWGAPRSEPAKPAPPPPKPAPPPPRPEPKPAEPPPRVAAAAKEPPPRREPDPEITEDTDEVQREIVRWRTFDPLRAALLGVVFFLLFFLSSQGTLIALRVLKR